MKCPWCNSEFGFYLSKGTANCPRCSGKIVMAFKASRIVVLSPIAILAGYCLSRLLGGLGYLISGGLLLLCSAYIEKHY